MELAGLIGESPNLAWTSRERKKNERERRACARLWRRYPRRAEKWARSEKIT